MRRILAWFAVGVSVVALMLFVFVYVQLTSLTWEKVNGDAYVIFGLGGNVGVLGTSEGAVIVDTMTFPFQGKRIRALAEEVVGGPVHTVINTHYHRDHTHGNPAFPDAIQVLASERTREHLLARDADAWKGDAAASLPTALQKDLHDLVIGDKTVRVIHPGRGHTDGDVVVQFLEDRVIHLGDLFFNSRYPRIDRGGGGSARAWPATLDRVLALDFDFVIPGHGELSNADGLRGFQTFLAEAVAKVSASIQAGATREETQAGVELDSDEGYGPGGLPPILIMDLSSVLGEIWDELSGQ